ncbi:hypothetical protein OIV83_005068 [Microbotryomycetes sp. JL201]|nr:hypothetical protein OIV83_005068 [Microbotryomycetes sp. JL201]
MGGASFLSMGLGLWEGVGCSTAGFAIVAIFMALNGRAGSMWHISFPVLSRSSFGVFGAGWATFNRACMSVVWSGVNSVSGGQCVYVMLHAIFPGIARIPNKLSPDLALTSASMFCFFIFVFLTAVMVTLPLKKWYWLTYTKSAVFVLSAVGMIALSVTQAGGSAGPAVTQGGTATGSTRHWLLIRFVLTSAASCSTFASNASDWQRNAIKPSDPILGQILGFPLANMVVSIIGLLVASTSQVVTGEIMWNPLEYLDAILTQSYTPSIRAGVFFISLGFTYSQLFSSAIENAYPFANDFSALLPRFFNIRRSLYLCLVLTIAINPWYLLGSASIFISVLASYQIFLFSIMAVLLVDYYLIAKGLFHVEDLYTTSRQGTYWYTYGVNFRAFAAYLVGVAVNFYGFLGNVGAIDVGVATTRSYYFAIFTTTTAAGLTYFALSKIWPVRHYNVKWSEPVSWEPEDGQPSVVKYDSEAGSTTDEDAKEKDFATAFAQPVV